MLLTFLLQLLWIFIVSFSPLPNLGCLTSTLTTPAPIARFSRCKRKPLSPAGEQLLVECLPLLLCPERYGPRHPSHTNLYVLEPVAGQPHPVFPSSSPHCSGFQTKVYWSRWHFWEGPLLKTHLDSKATIWDEVALTSTCGQNLQSPVRSPSSLQGETRGLRGVHALWVFSLVGLELSGHWEWTKG